MKKRLFRKLLFLSIFMLCGYAQAQTVSGTVSDANGPLPGAAVVVKGTDKGTTTDFDGKYTLNEVPSNAVLVISFVGYVTQEIPVDGKTTIDVTLVEDANKLDEVVVVGYTTQTRGDLTGAVASVDVSEAIKTPVVNAAQLLEGRVTGVSVVNGGRPGDAPRVVIRGFGTVNNTNPLYIIDGVQTDDPNVLNNINPADIEQMNVLKDAAAAIYGARASNGVVIITTKSGKYNQGKAKISVDFYTGVAEVDNLPSFLNPQQHSQMMFESLSNVGATLTHPQYDPSGTGVFTVPATIQNLPASANGITETVPNGGTRWLDEITQTGQTQNVSVSIENGSETGRYFLSASYLNREGIQLETGFKRGNTRLNSEFKLPNKIIIGEHVNAAFARRQNQNGNQIQIAERAPSLLPVYDDNGNFGGAYSNAIGLSNTGNPVAALIRGKNDYTKTFEVFGDVYAIAELYDGLKFKTVASGRMESFNSVAFTSKSPEAAEPVSQNRLREGNTNRYSWTWTNTLNYDKTFGDHSINALVGIEAQEERRKANAISRTGFLFETPDFYLLNTGSGTPNIDAATDQTTSLFSIFGTINYSYKGKYLATVTLRRDKSSRFRGDNKTGNFPSFSGAWVVSKEDFFPQDGIISRLKLKASYGEIGNQSVVLGNPTINISSLSETFNNYAFNGSLELATGAALSQIGNPDLKWETSKSTNIGTELGFFNNTLSLSVEYFILKTEDMLTLDAAVTTAPDAPPRLVNLGNVENKGFDISIGYQNQTDSGFSYGITANISTYDNEVTKLLGAFQTGRSLRTGPLTRTQVGRPISSFYGRVVDGIFASEAEVAAAADQGFASDAAGVGRFKYRDLNNDGVINDDDRTFIGSPHPDFTYGINLNGAYKGFDLSAFFSGVQGNDIYNYDKIFTDFPTFVNGNRSTRVLDSWSPTNTGASLPALSTRVENQETDPSSFFVEDGSFLKLKNLQIGYTIPSNLTDKANLSSVRLYVQGTNLFTISNYDGVDPEILTNRGNLSLGIDENTFPVSRIFSIGVNVKF
jgi:TonB-linked SusC/RagA family outer membrane protein